LLSRVCEYRFPFGQRQPNRGRTRGSLPANHQSALQSTVESRTVLRRLWPPESDASAHLGLRRHASRQRIVFGPRRVARRRSASFLDVASAVVFAVCLRIAKLTL